MSSLSPAKVILLAVDFAVRANIDGIRHLAFQNRTILTKVLVFRILLTYLPETVPVDAYTEFIHDINQDLLDNSDDAEHIDSGPVDGLSEDQARRRVRRLRLLELSSGESATAHTDPLTLFLFQRSYKIEDEAGLLNQVVDLLVPFLDHAPAIRVWMASTVLPLLRRNLGYYSPDPTSYSLRQFENLSDRASVEYLLSQTGRTEDTYDKIGRDLRGLLAPWLCNSKRWSSRDNGTEQDAPQPSCPGWDQYTDWLLLHASKSWRVAVRAIEQWDGPRDADYGESPPLTMPDDHLQYLDRTYTRASLASAYLVPEGTTEALEGAYSILTRVKLNLGQEQPLPLQDASHNCPTIPELNEAALSGRKVTAASLRNDLLETSNSLTSPQKEATDFLQGLILSAFILTRLGVVCTVRRAGDLVLLRDEREQKGEVIKLIRLIAHRAPKNDDEYWKRTRRDLLWLHNWGSESHDPAHPAVVGVFGLVSKDDIEVEILKALLTNMRMYLVIYYAVCNTKAEQVMLSRNHFTKMQQ
jgi:protein transport protein SEC39